MGVYNKRTEGWKLSVDMELSEGKDAMMEFLLQLLKEEREKRKAVEAEVVILKAILEPLQQKEMNHYSKKRETAIQNMRENFYRKQGKILCDGGMNDDEAAGGGDFDTIDSLDRVDNLECPTCKASYCVDDHSKFLTHVEVCSSHRMKKGGETLENIKRHSLS